MKERIKRALVATLALLLVLSAAACGPKQPEPVADPGKAETPSKSTGSTAEPVKEAGGEEEKPVFTVYDSDEDIYFANFQEFYDYYNAAMEAETVAERYALLAMAEAKHLQAAAGRPLYGPTASYGMNRQVFRTGGYAPWRGGMSDYSQYVLTNEPILVEDWNYTKELWSNLIGTGTYVDEAMKYLTGKGYTFQDTIHGTFSANATTWNIFQASSMNDSNMIRPTFDYLYVYNAEGELVPHLATSYSFNEDGTVLTLKIREGIKWVDSQGRIVADLTADDWLASAQHQADNLDCDTLRLYVKDFAAYADGETTDFSTVGIKALDDYTLQYTLVKPCTYFVSMFESLDFLPLCRKYFLAQGGAFGLSEFAEASASPSYLYGTDQDHIPSCGPYICTNMTEKNSVTYEQNPYYWNKENTNILYVKLLYDDGSDSSRAYDDFTKGVSNYLYLNDARASIAKENGDYDKYAVMGDVGRASFVMYYNLHRQQYSNITDGAIPSLKTDAEKALSEAAFQNRHFRLALSYGFDAAAYVAPNVGELVKYVSLRNAYTPGTYVNLPEDITVEINGVATSFPQGTWYGEIVQAQLDADGFPVKVWDPVTQSNEGWDAWYNPELAKQELAIAIEELAAAGYTVDANNPIVIDYPYWAVSEVGQNQGQVVKMKLEESLGDLIRVDLLALNNNNENRGVMLAANSGAEVNYDIGGLGTFGSDHGDPECYLMHFLPYGDGSNCLRMGLFY